jgi:hypothetical protein
MTQRQIAKLPRLLHMKYAPSELAEEIGCNVDTIYRSFVKSGCPHERDDKGHIWIVGDLFRAWAQETIQHHPRAVKMAEDEAYCLHCRKVVKMKFEGIRPANLYAEFVTGRCIECGARVNRSRAIRNGYH